VIASFPAVKVHCKVSYVKFPSSLRASVALVDRQVVSHSQFGALCLMGNNFALLSSPFNSNSLGEATRDHSKSRYFTQNDDGHFGDWCFVKEAPQCCGEILSQEMSCILQRRRRRPCQIAKETKRNHAREYRN
jgi:hypothetical protein